MPKKHPMLDYPEVERVKYLVIVASMAAADKKLAVEEFKHIEELCRNFKLEQKSQATVLAAAKNPPSNIRDTLEDFRNSDLRFALMIDSLFLAYADNVVIDAEESEIKKLAEFLRISEDQLSTLRKYIEAVRRAEKVGTRLNNLKKLGTEIAADFAATGIPIGAVAISGSVFGLSAAGITSGLSALALGLGMVPGIGVAVGIGIGSYLGVKWLCKKIFGD